MTLRRAVLTALLVAGGCCPRPAAAPRTAADARAPAAAPHPLTGRIWDVAAGGAIDRGALVTRLAAADVVLLGETHDNPRHHLWQAELVAALVAGARRPAVAFEMIESDRQAAVDGARRTRPRDPELLAHAVAWQDSGWPAFALYRPIVAAALDAELPVVAANLPIADVRALARGGLGGIDAGRAAALGIDRPLAPEIQAALEAEMAESHCGMLPATMLGGLVLAQRARDAQLAESIRAAGATGAIGILGAGHARSDRGVPARLRETAPELTVAAVAFLEVDPELREPAGYAAMFGATRLPFDVVVFTEPEPREDPCESMRHAHRRR